MTSKTPTPRPEWRAWRVPKTPQHDPYTGTALPVSLEHRWFKTYDAAERWAGALQGCVWWCVETWRQPPARSWERDQRPDFEAYAWGSIDTAGVSMVVWSWHGRRLRWPSEAPDAPRAAVPADVVLRALEGNAYAPPTRAPTGEVEPAIAAAIEGGLARIEQQRDHRGLLEWVVPTVAGGLALSRWRLQHARPVSSTADTRDALAVWRAAAQNSRGEPLTWKTAPDHHARLVRWGELLDCIARDRTTAEVGLPRFETFERYGTGEQRVLSFAAGVVVIQICDPRGWVWVVADVVPVVPWAPGSAWVPRMTRDEHRLPFRHATTHGRREWAEEEAERRRAAGAGHEDPLRPSEPIT